MAEEGSFVPAGEKESLQELQIRTHFFANSVSNFYPVSAYLPKERAAVIGTLQHVIDTVREEEMVEYRSSLKALG